MISINTLVIALVFMTWYCLLMYLQAGAMVATTMGVGYAHGGCVVF